MRLYHNLQVRAFQFLYDNDLILTWHPFIGHVTVHQLVTGEFPAQIASNAEIFPFDDVILFRLLHE